MYMRSDAFGVKGLEESCYDNDVLITRAFEMKFVCTSFRSKCNSCFMNPVDYGTTECPPAPGLLNKNLRTLKPEWPVIHTV